MADLPSTDLGAIEADGRARVGSRRDEIVHAVSDAIAIPSLPGSLAQDDVHRVIAAAAGGVADDVDRWIPDWSAVAAMTRSGARSTNP